MALDPYRVGVVLMNWAAASAQLRHKGPRNSLTYMHPSEPEALFVKAMMDNEPTAAILERWPDLDPRQHFAASPAGPPVTRPKKRHREPGFGKLGA